MQILNISTTVRPSESLTCKPFGIKLKGTDAKVNLEVSSATLYEIYIKEGNITGLSCSVDLNVTGAELITKIPPVVNVVDGVIVGLDVTDARLSSNITVDSINNAFAGKVQLEVVSASITQGIVRALVEPVTASVDLIVTSATLGERDV